MTTRVLHRALLLQAPAPGPRKVRRNISTACRPESSSDSSGTAVFQAVPERSRAPGGKAAKKKTRGFVVTEMNIADHIGASTCTDMRNAIDNWEAGVPYWHDAYALLVGDTDVIAHCTSPDGDQTDDLYASTNGDDLDEEIYLGRLSVDSEADLANQVTNIVAYEDNPSLFCCYHRAGLWAHKENAPGKYEGAHEAVRTFAYSNAPVFETFYGSQSGVTDSDVASRVSNGVGLMAYRGHGSRDATATSWNQTSEYFEGADVATLSNPLSRSPVGRHPPSAFQVS